MGTLYPTAHLSSKSQRWGAGVIREHHWFCDRISSLSHIHTGSCVSLKLVSCIPDFSCLGDPLTCLPGGHKVNQRCSSLTESLFSCSPETWEQFITAYFASPGSRLKLPNIVHFPWSLVATSLQTASSVFTALGTAREWKAECWREEVRKVVRGFDGPALLLSSHKLRLLRKMSCCLFCL